MGLVNLSHTLANDTSADADDVMDNFNDLVNALGSIRNSNIPNDAAIDTRKLAEPFTYWEDTQILLPRVGGTDYNASAHAATNFSTSFLTMYERRVTKRSADRLWLCLFEAYVLDVDTTGGTPDINLLVDGIQIGGAHVSLTTDDSYYHLDNANPIDNPLIPLADQSVIEVQMRESASGTVQARGVYIRLGFKRSMVP